MDLDLINKRVLVTAGSYGLGYACAKSLSREGARVVICSRDYDNVSSAIKSIRDETGNEVQGFVCDLSEMSELDSAVERARELLGEVDILVVCTGHPPTYPFSAASDEDWKSGMDLLLQPAIKLTRGVLPQMKSQGFGRLIYIGSVFGLEPEVSSVIQSTLRTGLNAFSKCVATENAKYGVTANVVCPGYFDTPLCRDLAGKYASEQGKSSETILDIWKSIAPIGEFGDPDDLGSLVAYLSSARAKFITGTSIAIDGGFLRHY